MKDPPSFGSSVQYGFPKSTSSGIGAGGRGNLDRFGLDIT